MCKVLTLAFLVLFNVVVYNAGAQVLLKENFEGSSVPPAGWVVSGNTWYGNAVVGNVLSGTKSLQTYPYPGTGNFDSWMISPGLVLAAGNTYRISYWYNTNNAANTKKMNITWGGGNIADSQVNMLHQYSGFTNTLFKEGVDTFVSSRNGTFYFGFYIKDTANYIGETFIDSIVIQRMFGESCSGVPLPGTVSGSSEYCTTEPVKLVLSGTYTGYNYSFEWYSSPAGQNNFSLITGATSTVLYNSQTVPLDYRCRVICNNTGQSAWSNIFSVTNNVLCYCSPGSANCGGTINSVEFAGLMNFNGCIYPAYTDNTQAVAVRNITAGTTVPIKIGVSYDNRYSLSGWIDYNRNGVFESNEFTNFGEIDGNYLYRNIIVPENATSGISRMRLRSQFLSNWSGGDACKAVQYGETEDYAVNIIANPPCAGVPSEGITVAPDSVCSDVAFNLSMSNNYDYTGLSFQWQSATNNTSNFTDIAGAVSKTSSVTQNIKTYYRCRVTCNNSGLISYSNIDSVCASLCYCASDNNCSIGGGIGIVSIGTMQNVSGCLSGYEYYGNTVAAPVIKKGGTYILSVRGGGDDFYISCWVDYDANGIYSESEFVYAGICDTAFMKIPISIPLTAATGKLGIRVRTDKSAPVVEFQACTQFNFGEVEDYLLNVQPANMCSGVPAGISTTGPGVACQGLSFNVFLTGNYFEPGYIYEWQSSPTGANNFTVISQADKPVLATTITTATDYRCLITCQPSGLSFTTNSISVQPVLCYCTPYVECSSSGYISNVTMGGINNSSGSCFFNGYSNFTSLAPATDTAGTFLPVTLTSVGSGYLGLWIDYNRDGNFTAAEFTSIGYRTAGAYTTNVFIPSYILPGLTRVRVFFKMSSAGSINPNTDGCTKDGYGEMEDYLINILPAPITILHNPVADTLYDPIINLSANIRQWDVGLNTTDAFKPRLWAKRAGTSSWKSFKGILLSGNANNGDWKFPIIPDSLGIRRNGCDSISYYIVAQDANMPFNVGCLPEQGARHTNVAMQVSAPSALFGIKIIPRLKDTVYVSQSDCRFTSLTKPSGLFQHINSRGLEGNLCIMLESDLSENGTNELRGAAMNNYSVIIKPGIDSVSIATTNTIRLNGVKNLTIDGSFNGRSRRLLIANPFGWYYNDTSCMIRIYNSCSNLIIRNCKIDYLPFNGINTIEAPIVIAYGNNQQLYFENNLFERNATGTQMAHCLISATGNNRAIVKGNEFNNFFGIAVNVIDSCAGWVIDSNHFYRSVIPQAPVYNYYGGFEAIKIAGSGHFITRNYIGGSRPFCQGSGFPIVSGNIKAIHVTGNPGLFPLTIKNNRVDNIKESSLATPSSSQYHFFGISVDENKVIVKDNIIGNPDTTGYSISIHAVTLSGITLRSKKDSSEISGNIIAGITNKVIGASSEVSMGGISAINYDAIGFGVASAASFNISNNHVFNIRNTDEYSGSLYGIYLVGGHSNQVKKNSINNLLTESQMTGIYYRGVYGDTLSVIAANRIYGLVNPKISDALHTINGISLNTTRPIDVINNQITLTNNNLASPAILYGIYAPAHYLPVVTNQRFLNNTIYIGGQATQSGGSCVYYSEELPFQYIYNNFFYNERTGGVQGNYIYKIDSWEPFFPIYVNRFIENDEMNNNLYLLTDTAQFAQWNYASSSSQIGWQQWKQETQMDAASYWSNPSVIPSASIFINPDTANLNINAGSNLCWAVNGKALPLPQVSSDFDGVDFRSVSLATGASDIGADEFNTATLPPPLVITNHRVLGGRDTLNQHGRVAAIIKWGNTGTLPVLGIPRLYTGKWPNDITNGGQAISSSVMNTWWDIPASGGSNYTYSIELWYDSSMLGKVQQQQGMVINKRTHNTAGSWQSLAPPFSNVSNHVLGATGITSFSEFSAADGASSLGNFGKSTCANGNASFTTDKLGSGFSYQWQVDTSSGFSNIINGGVYSGATDSVLNISSVSTQMNGYQYRCISTSGSVNTTGIIYVLKVSVVWTGAINTDWVNAGNWSCGIIPDAKTDVIIPSGLSVYPVVTQNVSCHRLIISQGASLTVNPGFSISITIR